MSEKKQRNYDWWKPKVNWDCPAGNLLKKFIEGVESPAFEMTIFGSAALQLTLSPEFLSADVDFFSNQDFNEEIKKLHLGKGQAGLYLEQPSAKIFIASSDWSSRAHKEQFKKATVVFPHPIDILTAKVKRTVEKDLQAFFLVRELTGHPTEFEMINALQNVVDMYRPAFDEENPGGDPFVSTKRFWKEFFGKEIDIRKEIIIPALEERRKYFDPLPKEVKSTIKSILSEDDS